MKAASLVLGKASSGKLAKTSFSDSALKIRIDELANDIEFQVLEKMQTSFLFAIHCDETTDVTQLSQLLVYVRYVRSTSIEKEMLFCRPLETIAKTEDVFKVVAGILWW